MNVFVVEGAPEIRKRLVAMVKTVSGVCVIGEADTVQEAGDAIAGGDVETLLLSLQTMAGGDLDSLARLKRARPQLRAIVLTNFTSQQYLQASLAAGAEFCLDKTREFGRVPEILRDWIETSGHRQEA